MMVRKVYRRYGSASRVILGYYGAKRVSVVFFGMVLFSIMLKRHMVRRRLAKRPLRITKVAWKNLVKRSLNSYWLKVFLSIVSLKFFLGRWIARRNSRFYGRYFYRTPLDRRRKSSARWLLLALHVKRFLHIKSLKRSSSFVPVVMSMKYNAKRRKRYISWSKFKHNLRPGDGPTWEQFDPVKSAAMRIAAWSKSRMRKNFSRVAVPIRVDWEYWLLLRVIALLVVVWVVLSVTLRYMAVSFEVVTAMDLSLLGFVVVVVCLYFYHYNEYAEPKNFKILGEESRFDYSRYVNQSAVDYSFRRRDWFYGSGYNNVEHVVVNKHMFAELEFGMLSYKPSKTFYHNCLSYLLSKYKDALEDMDANGLRLFSHRAKVAARVLSQLRELEGVKHAARTSLLTRATVDDLDFVQRGSRGVFGRTLLPGTGPSNHKN
jgi:hypothetical protein